MTLQQHFFSEGPKRVLALDGGGIRGALTLGYLKKMETQLREQHGNKKLRLCDYFDLIGGTSTGSIIAACLAIGKEVDEIRELYFDLGGKIFGDKFKWYEISKVIKAKYDARPLEEELQKLFQDIKMGGEEILTGLCIVTKRADTNSTWPFINHPLGKFYDSPLGKNKDIPLRLAVRASAAAPSYFLPEVIEVGGDMSTAAFIDGGVSMANNPSLLLLMVATMKGYPFQWKKGARNLLLVSVGTGMSRLNKLPKQITENHLLKWAQSIPDLFMQDASWNNQAILQWLSHSPTAKFIDMEVGNLAGELLVEGEGLLSYLRYNFLLGTEELNALKLKNKNYTPEQVEDLSEMSNAGNRFELYDIGLAAAEKEIDAVHFPDYFKI
jgi:uncharacterized protein